MLHRLRTYLVSLEEASLLLLSHWAHWPGPPALRRISREIVLTIALAPLDYVLVAFLRQNQEPDL